MLNLLQFILIGHSVKCCKGNPNITSVFIVGEKYYSVILNIGDLAATTTEIKVKLDSAGTEFFDDRFPPEDSSASFTIDNDLINNVFTFILLKHFKSSFLFKVKGKFGPERPPYVISLKINGQEKCVEPNREYFENYPDMDIEHFWPNAPDKFCGRGRINKLYTELITSGSASKSGNWPWHTAIYRLSGGVSKYSLV